MPYSGAQITELFRHRWRYGGAQVETGVPQFVGAAKPRTVMEVRRGRFVRSYHTGQEWHDGGGAIFGDVAGGSGRLWYPDWQPLDDWTVVGAVKDWRGEQSFDNKGITAMTITLDNSILEEKVGEAGAYHVIGKGWFTPLRGFQAPGRPDTGIERSPFYQRLPNAQFRIRAGYGSELTTICLGLIDVMNTGSKPTTMQITGRDMGGPMLVDQHFFGWAKERQVRDPVTFMPRAMAEKREYRGGGALASSQRTGWPASNVLKESGVWMSDAHTSEDATEWIEIHVPAGRYRAIYVNAALPDQDLYVGVFAKPRGEEKLLHSRWLPNAGETGEVILDEDYLDVKGYKADPAGGAPVPYGWVKFNANVVPGDNGGWPYIVKRSRVDGTKGTRIHFGGELRLGTDSVIRVGVRHLAKVDRSYRAGIITLKAEARNPTTEAVSAHWVLVDDVSEIVECCLRWAGFKGWEIETTGVDLKQPYVVDKSKTFMDVIDEIKESVGYTFFVSEPRDDDNDQDLGYPVFRQNRIFDPRQDRIEELTDQDLLTDGKFVQDNTAERYIIRGRGKLISAKEGGRWLGGEKTNRAMYVYRPPWHDRMAGIIKHFTHNDPKWETITDCQFGCYVMALQMALAINTGQVAIPGTPHIGIDSSVSVIDRPSGMNSRMYVSNRVQTFTAGEDARYVTELGGALADTPDVLGVALDYLAASATIDRNGAALTPKRPRRPAHNIGNPVTGGSVAP